MVRVFFAGLLLILPAANSVVAQEHGATAATPLSLWPESVPGEADLPESLLAKIREREETNTAERVFGVTKPTLTVYQAKADMANGAAVLICPGGGYNILAWDHEGVDIAKWLNGLGVHAFVLKYRVPRRPDDFMRPPLQDAQRAMRLIRSGATGVQVDENRIGILGFSAGGSLTINTATRYDEQTYKAVDALDKVSCRPDFMIPIYAAYQGSKQNDRRLTEDLKVTSDTPPAFLVVTQDDKNRGLHAALVFAELTRQNIPAEVHVFTAGGHGYGMRDTGDPVSQWPKLCEQWMRGQGFLTRK